jgi:hypothetical protein
MKQERLNALDILAVESEMLDRISYKNIIEDLISKNSYRIMFFK